MKKMKRGHNKDRLDGPTRGGNLFVVPKYRAQQRMKHTPVNKDSHYSKDLF